MENGELTGRERGRLWLRLGLRLALAGLAALFLVLAGPPLLSLFMPFVLAFLLAWILNPPIRWVQKRVGVNRRLLSFLLIFILLAGAGGLLFAFLFNIVSEIVSLANNWQAILIEVQAAVDAVSAAFSDFMDLLPAGVSAASAEITARFLDWLKISLPDMLSAAATRATGFAMGVPSFAVASVVFIMGSYFITADYPRIRLMVTQRLSGGIKEFMGHVRATAMAAFGGYVKAQLILTVGVFFILMLGFTAIRQPYGLLLAFLLAILDFIPIVGAGTAMIPWALVDLISGNYRHAVEMLVIWGIIALFRRMAEAKVVGDQTGLPPILSLVSIYVGMRLGGVWGMILGPVLCMVLLNICRSGVFSGVAADVRLAAQDLAALLSREL